MIFAFLFYTLFYMALILIAACAVYVLYILLDRRHAKRFLRHARSFNDEWRKERG